MTLIYYVIEPGYVVIDAIKKFKCIYFTKSQHWDIKTWRIAELLPRAQ